MRQSIRARRRPDPGWLLVLLALLVLPFASWHDATTVHEVCPEHGETLDVAVGGVGHDDAQEGPRWNALEDGHDDHELCPYLPLGQPSAPLAEVGLARACLPETRIEATLAEGERHAPISPLVLAPKQSPPV